jgi:hypothetical protein
MRSLTELTRGSPLAVRLRVISTKHSSRRSSSLFVIPSARSLGCTVFPTSAFREDRLFDKRWSPCVFGALLSPRKRPLILFGAARGGHASRSTSMQRAPRHSRIGPMGMGRAPTLIHVKAIKPATNERRNFAPLRDATWARHHGPRHIALSSFTDLAGHGDGRMRLRAGHGVRPPWLAASFIPDGASVSFSAPAPSRSRARRP